jgi:hypothetical protein|tara:strand:+ start:1958 stop:2275 length:318 start_codon:yes stop_codon:yes gene_type:complete
MCKIALMSGKNLSSLTGECNSLADSPCIGWCTVRQFGDKRCKGCGRYDFEADSTFWFNAPELIRKLINLRNAAAGYSIKQLRGNARPVPKAVANRPSKEDPSTQY